MAMTVKEALEYTRQQAIESGARRVSPEERADFLRSLPDDERRKEIDMDISIGRSAPRYKGVWGEMGAGIMQTGTSMLRGIGATVKETTGYSGMQDYFGGVLRSNQQWNRPEGYSNWHPAMMLRSGAEALTTTVPSVATGVATTAATGNPVAGGAASAFMFSLPEFGETVQRNRAAGYNEDKAYGLALLETGINGVIEMAPWGVAGKAIGNTGKAIKNANRLNKITDAGKRDLLRRVEKRIAEKVGVQKAHGLLYTIGKNMAQGSITEAGEEGLQYLNSYLWQKAGGDPNAVFSKDELIENIAQGFIGGFMLGGAGGVIDYKVNNRSGVETANNTATETATQSNQAPFGAKAGTEYGNTTNATTATPQQATTDTTGGYMQTVSFDEMKPGEVTTRTNADGTTVMYTKNDDGTLTEMPFDMTNETAPNISTEENPVQSEQAHTINEQAITTGETLLKELGVPFRNMTEEEQKSANEKGALFQTDGDTILINPIAKTNAEMRGVFMEGLGHDLKHYIDVNYPELGKLFDQSSEQNKTEKREQYYNQLKSDYGLEKDERSATEELNADMFGKVLNDPITLRQAARIAESRKSGFGQKLIQAVIEYCKKIMAACKRLGTPDAKQYFLHYKQVRDVAAQTLAEIRQRKVMKDERAAQIQAEEELNYNPETGVSTETDEGNPTIVSEKQKELTRQTEAEKSSGISTNKKGEMRQVETIPLDELNLDPERFQYKSGKNKKTGVVNELSGEFDQEQARPIYVWEDKDGKKFVVEGHHRYDLAKRSGKEKITAYVHREIEDGETAKQARRNGVLRNILDDQGDAKDMIEFFRDEKMTQEEAKSKGLLRKDSKAITSQIIAEHTSDNLYQQIMSGEISIPAGAAIAEEAKGNAALEGIGIQMARKKVGAEAIRQRLQIIKNNVSEEQFADVDMFGENTADKALQLSDAIQKQAEEKLDKLKRDVDVARKVARNPESAQATDIKRGKSSDRKLAEAEKELARWENWITDSELNDQLVKELGLEKLRDEVKGVIANTIPEQQTKVKTPATEEKKTEAKKPEMSEEFPLLTKEEDANDFQLSGEKINEKEQKAIDEKKKAESEKQAKKNTPDLFPTENKEEQKPQNEIGKDNNVTTSNTTVDQKKSEDVETGYQFVMDETKKNPEDIISSAKNGSNARIQAFLDLKDGEHVISGNTFTKEGNVFKRNGQKLSARGIEKSFWRTQNATSVKDEKAKTPKAETTRTKEEDEEAREKLLGVKIDVALNVANKAASQYERSYGNQIKVRLQDAAIDGLTKAIKKIDFSMSEEEQNAFMHTVVVNQIRKELNKIKEENKIVTNSLDEEVSNGKEGDNRTRAEQTPDINANKTKETEEATEAYEHVFVKLAEAKDENGKRLFSDRDIKIFRRVTFVNAKLTKEKQIDIAKDFNISEVMVSKIAKRMTDYTIRHREIMNYLYRKHQQINPVLQPGQIQTEHQDFLNNREYTPENVEDWNKTAVDWIVRQGGVQPAMEKILAGKMPEERHVTTLAIRNIENSDVFKKMPLEKRVSLMEKYIDGLGKSWGREGAARRWNSLKMDSVERVQAWFNKIHEMMPDEKFMKLRNDILDMTRKKDKNGVGVDILKLNESIMKDKYKLDSVIREFITRRDDWYKMLPDWGYELWINGLFGIKTHTTNVVSNIANIAYELGAKRFTEAVANAAANIFGKRVKGGATFGEFKYMMKNMKWKNLLNGLKEGFLIETLDVENNKVSGILPHIPGKVGRIIRLNGALLRAEDQMLRQLTAPMEAASFAYRQGSENGLSGNELKSYIEKQMNDKTSEANRYGFEQALKFTFNETLPKGRIDAQFLNMLTRIKNDKSVFGFLAKTLMPFVKIPYNITRQSVRKSPLGAANLLWQTGKAALGKRAIDSEYIGLLSEQILAWSTLGALISMGGNDGEDLPITGTGALWGSNERKFQNQNRPPHSIRINGKWYDYSRIEPFSGVLETAGNLAEAFYKDDSKEFVKAYGKAVKSLSEKSYFKTLAEIRDLLTANEYTVKNTVSNYIASWIPNVIREQMRNNDDVVRERAGADFFDLVKTASGIPVLSPKVDYFGRDIPKDVQSTQGGSSLWRLLPVTAKADGYGDRADTLLRNYNQQNPKDAYFPGLPDKSFNLNGKKYQFTGANYYEFTRKSGELAHKQVNNAIKHNRLNVDNPKEADIELIKKIFLRARKETKEKMVRAGKYESVEK